MFAIIQISAAKMLKLINKKLTTTTTTTTTKFVALSYYPTLNFYPRLFRVHCKQIAMSCYGFSMKQYLDFEQILMRSYVISMISKGSRRS